MTQESFEQLRDELEDFRERVYYLTRQIPSGMVATYGQLAFLAGHPGAARAVGSFLKESVPSDALPWQRVLNAQGRISFKGDTARALLQQRRLEAEGVTFNASGRCKLEEIEWEPALPYWAKDWQSEQE